VGLVPDEDITNRIVLVRTLQGARTARQPDQRLPDAGDVARQDRYVALERRARTLRADLQRILADRALLLDQRNEESDYEQSLQLQTGPSHQPEPDRARVRQWHRQRVGVPGMRSSHRRGRSHSRSVALQPEPPAQPA
jgi:hypothetical protein